MTSMLLTFVDVSVMLTLVPGPHTLLVVRSGLRGRARATAVGIGTALAALLWGVVAAFGLAVVLEQSALAFTAVKLAGAAYLMLLGVRTLWQLRRSAHLVEGPANDADLPATAEVGSIRASLLPGVIAGVLNPKTGLFYVAVLPQVIPSNASVLSSTLAFAVIDAVIVAVYFVLLAALAAMLLPYLRRPNVMRGAERATGISLIGLGVYAAAEKV